MFPSQYANGDNSLAFGGINLHKPRIINVNKVAGCSCHLSEQQAMHNVKKKFIRIKALTNSRDFLGGNVENIAAVTSYLNFKLRTFFYKKYMLCGIYLATLSCKKKWGEWCSLSRKKKSQNLTFS